MVTTEAFFQILIAVEILVTADGSRLQRAQQALIALRKIDGTEFSGAGAIVLWECISSAAESITSGYVDDQELDIFIRAVWQLFEACCVRPNVQ